MPGNEEGMDLLPSKLFLSFMSDAQLCSLTTSHAFCPRFWSQRCAKLAPLYLNPVTFCSTPRAAEQSPNMLIILAFNLLFHRGV